MPALTAKESARYGVRLFGYLLATTLLGGAFVGGGVALAVTMAPDVLPGGSAPSNYAVLAGAGVLVLVGGLVLVTGVALVLFTVVADGVRVGTGRRPTEPATGEVQSDDTTDSEESSASVGDDSEGPETTKPETTQPTPSVEPASASDSGTEMAEQSQGTAEAAPESTQADPLGPSTEATEDDREALDPNDPIDDPHAATTNPFGEPEPSTEAEEWSGKETKAAEEKRRAGPAEDDEAWREEIEAKLEAEDEEASGEAN